MDTKNHIAAGSFAVSVGIVTLLVSGCTATASPAPSVPSTTAPITSPRFPPPEGSVTVLDTQAGLPPGVTQSPLPPEHFPVPLAFTDPDNADVLWIGSWGSSSCPSIPATYSISAHGVLTLTLEPDQEKIIPAPAQVPCTADRALTSTAIAVPDGVENPNEVIIREYTDISTPVHPYPEK